jgi:thioredoxin 1
MKKAVLALAFLLLSAAANADVVTLSGNKRVQGTVKAIDKNSITFVENKGGEKTYKMMQVDRAEFESKGATVHLKGKQKDVSGEIVCIEHGTLVMKDEKGSTQKIFIQNIEKIDITTEVLVISKKGAPVDINSVLEPGRVNIVDFYAEWCGPCKVMGPKLEDLAKSDPDVVLRKIDIDKWGSPVCNQYKIESVPNIRVYDRNGKQVGDSTFSLDEVEKLVSQAKK